MAWDIELAKRLRQLAKGAAASAPNTATVVQVNPLVLSAYGGELLLTGDALTLTKTAKERTWDINDEAAVLIGGGGMLVIDKM